MTDETITSAAGEFDGPPAEPMNSGDAERAAIDALGRLFDAARGSIRPRQTGKAALMSDVGTVAAALASHAQVAPSLDDHPGCGTAPTETTMTRDLRAAWVEWQTHDSNGDPTAYSEQDAEAEFDAWLVGLAYRPQATASDEALTDAAVALNHVFGPWLPNSVHADERADLCRRGVEAVVVAALASRPGRDDQVERG